MKENYLKYVYVLQHTNISEDVKFIGVFSTKRTANNAILELKNTSGFKENSSGFSIDLYDIDKIHWSEGFISL